MYFVCGVGEFFSTIDSDTLAQKYAHVYMQDKRFWIPLYSIVFFETLAWIWSLVLFSDQVEIDSPFFKIKEMGWG
jgi:hypothetical protein